MTEQVMTSDNSCWSGSPFSRSTCDHRDTHARTVCCCLPGLDPPYPFQTTRPPQPPRLTTCAAAAVARCT
eukprot:COSAG01_NODE_4618_length_4876_cov_8.446305_4_plen_70_part_00